MSLTKLCVLLLSVFSVSILAENCYVKQNAQNVQDYCKNDSVTCKSLIKSPGLSGNISTKDVDDYCLLPSDSDCMVEVVGDCGSLTFDGHSTTNLGAVKLKVYPLSVGGFMYPIINITLTDVRWTSLLIRYMQLNNHGRTFCRKLVLSSHCNFSELFYDCRWINIADIHKTYIFEYQAERESHKETRKYYFDLLPFGSTFHSSECELRHWVPLLYVDVSELPVLTGRWQQVPHHLGVQQYEVKVYDREELKISEIINGTENEDEELSYSFTEKFPTYGEYSFQVCILNNACNCKNGVCQFKSTVISVGNSTKITLGVVIGGCAILVPVLLLIIYVWKKKKSPLYDNERPAVLIIYTPSNASHVKAVKEFAEYLRNCCYVKALLDQLDIPDTETKDPFEWYNNNFDDPDFIMVVSSPPACCQQEGIYKNLDVLALNLFKAKFSSHGSRSQFFAVVLPYCTKQHIPSEARNIRRFRLMKDLDKMLWFIHNSGNVPTFFDSLCALFGPKPYGGKTDLKIKGMGLLKALKEAEYAPPMVCNCKDLKRENEESHSRFPTQTFVDVPEWEIHSETSSIKFVDRELVDMYPEDSILDEMNLSGEEDVDLKPLNKSKCIADSESDIDNLEL